MKKILYLRTLTATVGLMAVAAPLQWAAADQVIVDDLIVDGSACIGQDCVNGESFGFDTLRLKENNLRIKFDDTSSSGSFPSNDWQITANDTSNGGVNKFSIDDITGGKTPFTIEAAAPSHSLYVDDIGRIGFGTNSPVVNLHVIEGNTPTLRLEQDGSSGFTPQTWDVAGNETNFFIRDATNGSKLPFKIKPGADDNALFIAADNDIGLRTASPAAPLHLNLGSGDAAGTGNAVLLLERNGGPIGIQFKDNDNSGSFWNLTASNSSTAFNISRNGTGATEFSIGEDGVMTLRKLASAPAMAGIGDVYVDSSGGFCVATAANTWTNISGAGDCI